MRASGIACRGSKSGEFGTLFVMYIIAMRHTAETEARLQDLQMSENVYLCDMRAVELKLSEILNNPEQYENITGVVARNTNHPAEDLARGWSRAGSGEAHKGFGSALVYLGYADNLCDLRDSMIDIEAIERRVNRGFASEAEEIIFRLRSEEHDAYYESLDRLHELLSEEECEAVIEYLNERLIEEQGIMIRYYAAWGGWFIAERGLSAYGGDNLVEAVENACDDERFSDCKYIVAFYPSRVHTDSDSDVRAGYVVAAEPDLTREVYIIERDC